MDVRLKTITKYLIEIVVCASFHSSFDEYHNEWDDLYNDTLIDDYKILLLAKFRMWVRLPSQKV